MKSKPTYRHLAAIAIVAFALVFSACREEDFIYIPDNVEVWHPEFTSIDGFYLLNEGNMNENKASLDYYDYASGTYRRDIYAESNPNVVMDLGDVGNDLAIYGDRMYAIINCSNKVEVMRKHNAERIGQVDIPNCRNIAFHGAYAYVTSYAGPVRIDPNYTQRGFVAKIDTATLQIVDTCLVGFQPNGIEIVNDKIYVVNSGGYMFPNYDNTMSVIDLATFEVVETVVIDINLQHCKSDSRGVLWISSQGDYYGKRACLYAYDTRKQRVLTRFDMAANSMWMDGDSLYVVSAAWLTEQGDISDAGYRIIDMSRLEIVNDSFITDGTHIDIVKPYAVAVNPITKDIYIADGNDYYHPGRLYCYSRDGVKKWSVRTGQIPGHIAFLGKQ